MSRQTKAQKAERAEAIEHLKQHLTPGTRVYCNLRHVSKSGMMRSISVHTVKDNELWHWSGYVAKALGWPLDDRRFAVKVSGCGMDMGFHLVYTLSSVLFGHAERGGYLLKHEWL